MFDEGGMNAVTASSDVVFHAFIYAHILSYSCLSQNTVTFCLPVIVACCEMCISPYIRPLSRAVRYDLCFIMIYYCQM